jgi:hypothetical protein
MPHPHAAPLHAQRVVDGAAGPDAVRCVQQGLVEVVLYLGQGDVVGLKQEGVLQVPCHLQQRVLCCKVQDCHALAFGRES